MTRVTPAHNGRAFTEGYLSQPYLGAHAGLWRNRIELTTVLNFEGTTLRRGELNPGMFGEGYVDRRHPHAYVHDLVATLSGVRSGFGASLAVGRGFTPFGTDDPMDRPFVKFPVNHHLAQVMERVLAVGALRWRGIVGELARFNGDEPVNSKSSPNWRRSGDSWAGRITLFPAAGLEIAASRADVVSPESYRTGGSFNQRKRSVSVRFEPPWESEWYALGEWARTIELAQDKYAFQFSSLLLEGSSPRFSAAGVRIAARVERTTRPEEERTLDPFRTVRPPHDFMILGVTRWDVATVSLSLTPQRVGLHGDQHGFGSLGIAPFAEVSQMRPKAMTRGSAFEPERHFGSSRLWSVSFGLTIRAGGMHGRHGRYGVAARDRLFGE
jgi:hypothetical protein